MQLGWTAAAMLPKQAWGTFRKHVTFFKHAAPDYRDWSVAMENDGFVESTRCSHPRHEQPVPRFGLQMCGRSLHALINVFSLSFAVKRERSIGAWWMVYGSAVGPIMALFSPTKILQLSHQQKFWSYKADSRLAWILLSANSPLYVYTYEYFRCSFTTSQAICLKNLMNSIFLME